MQNERFLIVGQSGTGKTWLAQYIADGYFKEHDAKVITISAHKNDLAKGDDFSYTSRMKEFNIKEEQLHQGINLKRAILDQPYLHLNVELTEEEIEESLDDIHKAIFSLDGPVVVVIDEAHTTFSKHHAPNSLVRCITQGRSEGVVPIVVLQDITGCNKVAVSQSNHLFAFRVTDTNDLNRLEKRFGKQVGDKLPNLDKFEAVHYNHDSGELEVINTKE